MRLGFRRPTLTLGAYLDDGRTRKKSPTEWFLVPETLENLLRYSLGTNMVRSS